MTLKMNPLGWQNTLVHFAGGRAELVPLSIRMDSLASLSSLHLSPLHLSAQVLLGPEPWAACPHALGPRATWLSSESHTSATGSRLLPAPSPGEGAQEGRASWAAVKLAGGCRGLMWAGCGLSYLQERVAFLGSRRPLQDGT